MFLHKNIDEVLGGFGEKRFVIISDNDLTGRKHFPGTEDKQLRFIFRQAEVGDKGNAETNAG